MAYKNKEDAQRYYQEYYYRKFGHYPVPFTKRTPEGKLAHERDMRKIWYYNNIEKAKLTAKKSREKHKEQRKLDNKLWLEKNKDWSKEYHKIYNKKWYQDNKETRSLQIKKYAQEHKKEIVGYVQKYAKKYPQKVKDYNKKFWITSAGAYRSIANRAKKWEGLLITLEEFKNISSKPCTYCGENKERIGIDRIDNLKGYTIENSTSCCKLCNFMKKTMTVNEFLTHIKKISEHNKT